MTFVNDQGGRFTALRTYYVPAPRAAVRRRPDAARHPRGRARPRRRSRPPCPSGSTPTPSRSSSRASGCTAPTPSSPPSCTPGSASAPTATARKALRLLARIQAGNQVRSVDELYKDMVLERPATYAAADRAIEHFDDLDAAYAAMRTEEQKLELLEPITALHDRKVAARRRLAELDSYGVTAVRATRPLRLWLLRTAPAAARGRGRRQPRRRARDRRRARRHDLGGERAAGDLEAAKEAHRAAGGSTSQSLALSLEQEPVVREDRLGRRAVLQERLLPLIEADRRRPTSTTRWSRPRRSPAPAARRSSGSTGWRGEHDGSGASATRCCDQRFPLQPAAGRAAPRARVAGGPRRPGAGAACTSCARGRPASGLGVDRAAVRRRADRRRPRGGALAHGDRDRPRRHRPA